MNKFIKYFIMIGIAFILIFIIGGFTALKYFMFSFMLQWTITHNTRWY